MVTKRKTIYFLSVIAVLACVLAETVLAADVDDTAHKIDIQQLQTNLNYIWVLVAAALVFIMQAGFMCVESGLATAKNSINVAIKNLADFVIASILFWLVGFGIMFGVSDSQWFGMSGFLINLKDPWQVVFFVFQAVFVGTAATIDSGAVAGRTKFGSYLIMSGLVSAVIYPVFGHWAWGSLLHGDAASGWLEKLGFIDFAGSTVVHSVGGWVALAGCMVVGPRLGKYSEDGSVNYIPPHNMALTYLGTFVLFFGWFGFNCGSTLEATSQIAGIALNTMLAACFGCFSASALSWITSPFKRPEGEMIANGLLGGLVGITAGCAVVETTGAMYIGLGAGVLVYFATHFIERVLKVDDVVGAIAVHGVCGAWGTVALALFIPAETLGEVSRGHQIYVQSVGVLACFFWTFGTAYLFLKAIDNFMGGMRVSSKDELLGLNIAEHGARSTIVELAESMHYATQNQDFSDRVKVEVEIGTEIGDLCDCFNRMVDAIQKALKETRHQIKTAENARHKAENAEGALQKSMAEIQHQIKTAETARKKAEDAEQAMIKNRERYEGRILEIAGNLTRMMSETENTMSLIAGAAQKVQTNVDSLSGAAQEIDTVLASIEKIAFSTKLLAINATIEAAHAGKTGKGFSVVSGEMGAVARYTESAVNTIAQFNDEIKKLLALVTESLTVQYKEIKDGNLRIDTAGRLVKSLLADDDQIDALPEKV